MTGVAPDALLDDALLYAACAEQAEAASWTDLHELVAINAEVTHAVFCQLIASAGGKPPEPMRIPRPGVKEKKPLTVSPLQAASLLMGS